jgi:hypothetical protein
LIEFLALDQMELALKKAELDQLQGDTDKSKIRPHRAHADNFRRGKGHRTDNPYSVNTAFYFLSRELRALVDLASRKRLKLGFVLRMLDLQSDAQTQGRDHHGQCK